MLSLPSVAAISDSRAAPSLPSVGAISDGIAPPQATGPTREGDGAGTGAWGGAGSLSDRQGRRDGEAQDDQNQDRP